jgi:plastocyanin
MRYAMLALLFTPSLMPTASAGDIRGKIPGWSGDTSHSQAAVVYLEGEADQTSIRNHPVMAQHGGQFEPAFLVVVVGQTVSMPNEDDVAHNVYSLSPTKSFDLGYYLRGEPRDVTFDQPGVVEVACVLHSTMRGIILVVPNRHYAIVQNDGSFRIRDVPAGEFVLQFWSEGMARVSRKVIVPVGRKTVNVGLALPEIAQGKQ